MSFSFSVRLSNCVTTAPKGNRKLRSICPCPCISVFKSNVIFLLFFLFLCSQSKSKPKLLKIQSRLWRVSHVLSLNLLLQVTCHSRVNADRVSWAAGVPLPSSSIMMRDVDDSHSQESVSLFVFLSAQKDGSPFNPMPLEIFTVLPCHRKLPSLTLRPVSLQDFWTVFDVYWGFQQSLSCWHSTESLSCWNQGQCEQHWTKPFW